MGLWSRIMLLFRTNANAALDRAEDPRLTFDYAYAQQQELLRKVREGLVEVATSKRQLEHQTRKILESIPRLEEQARRAVGVGREDLARTALQRRQTAVTELEDLQKHVTEVAQEESRLTSTEQALSARIEEFRAHRQVMTARYSAAEAQVHVQEALTGVSGELADLGVALGRAEEKVERMQARASALGELVEPGALSLPVGGDAVERELRRITGDRAIEEQLAAIKRELEPVKPAARRDGPLLTSPIAMGEGKTRPEIAPGA